MILSTFLIGLVLGGLLPTSPCWAAALEEPQEEPAKATVKEGAQNRLEEWPDEEVPYIITDEERSQFKTLTTDQDRERFIADFWERRNPDPGSPKNKFKNEYYRRVAYARERYHYLGPGARDDRARVYVLFGPPDRIEFPAREAERSGAAGRRSGPLPVERWTYHFIDGLGGDVVEDFVDPEHRGEYQDLERVGSPVDHTPSGGQQPDLPDTICDR